MDVTRLSAGERNDTAVEIEIRWQLNGNFEPMACAKSGRGCREKVSTSPAATTVGIPVLSTNTFVDVGVNHLLIAIRRLKMLDLNPQTAGDGKLGANRRLHLVKEAAGSFVANVRDSPDITDTIERLPCQIFDAFGTGSGDLHESLLPIGKAGVQPLARDDEDSTARCCGSLWIRVFETFKRWHQSWMQERRRREMIAYYRELPAWVLRDIGIERGEISYVVRNVSNSPANGVNFARRNTAISP